MHKLKAADIEEYRKKIVERDKNKDEEVAEKEKVRGERSKFERKEEKAEEEIRHNAEEEVREELERNQSDLHHVSSPPNVFTFDQEDIQTSKLLSFEKVSNYQIISVRSTT